MSLILDALSRAEREKRGNDGTAPDLLSQPQYVASSVSRGRTLRGLGAIALLLGFAALVFVYLDRSEPPAAVSTARPALTPSSARAQKPVADRQPATGEQAITAAKQPRPAPDLAATVSRDGEDHPARPGPELAPAEQRDEVQALYAAAQSPRPASSPAVPGEGTAVAAVPPADRGESPAPTRPENAPEPELLEEAVDLEAVLREVRSAAENDGLAPHPVPLLAEQSKQFRDRVPTLMYLRHDFNAAGQSRVFINGETLRVGQRTRGVEVREILADSVVLRFDGTDFRLRALNSWVNL